LAAPCHYRRSNRARALRDTSSNESRKSSNDARIVRAPAKAGTGSMRLLYDPNGADRRLDASTRMQSRWNSRATRTIC
ncbi:MAG TPA: hypothetical protein PLF26_14700, partial [Blastocatellia bacterium]|nr:hypothetical protein [Blastocatellia bacterium]